MKLPLEATIAGGYRFFFTRIVSIVGTLWFPYLLLLALAVGGAWLVLPHAVFRGDFTDLDVSLMKSAPVLTVRLALMLCGLVAAAMVAVGLMRLALGLKQTPTFVWFSLGLPVWRMVGAKLLATVILVLLFILLVLIGVGIGFAAYPHMQPSAGVTVIALASLLLFFVFVYSAVRLCFFLPAVVVAENRIGLGRSWQLGGGNFWRIFIVWLLVAVPVWFVVGIVLQSTILPVLMAELLRLPHHPTPEEIKPLLQSVWHMLPVVFPVMLLAGIVFRAVMAGAAGTAYNAVTAAKEDSAST